MSLVLVKEMQAGGLDWARSPTLWAAGRSPRSAASYSPASCSGLAPAREARSWSPCSGGPSQPRRWAESPRPWTPIPLTAMSCSPSSPIGGTALNHSTSTRSDSCTTRGQRS